MISLETEFYIEIKIAEKQTISTDLPSYNNPIGSCLSIFTPSLNSYLNNTTVDKQTNYDIFDQLGSGYVKEAYSRITEHLLDTNHPYISKSDLLRTAYTGEEITIEAEYEYMVNVSFDPGDNYVVNKTTKKTIIEK